MQKGLKGKVSSSGHGYSWICWDRMGTKSYLILMRLFIVNNNIYAYLFGVELGVGIGVPIERSGGWGQQNYIQVSSMSRSLLSFLYAELAYSIVFNALFGAFFVRQVMKLDKLSESLDTNIPRKVWLKFAIILAIIMLLGLHLVLAYTSQTYWLSAHPNFSLMVFLFIANYTMQGYIVLKLVTKSSGKRYLPNFFFWAFCMVVQIVEVAAVQMITQDSNFTVIISLFIAILNFLLLFISLIFDKSKPPSDLVKSLSDSQTSRTIEGSFHRYRWDKVMPSNRLFIQFHQNFEINQEESHLSCLFKIAVYIDEQATVITKKDTEFIKFGLEMQKMFPNRSEVVIPSHNRKYSNMMNYGQEQLKTYQTYLLDLTRTGEFIVPCLLDFLEVPASKRSKLVINERRQSFIRQESGLPEEEQKMRKPFFNVYSQSGKYILENPGFLEFIINKSTSQILQFYNKLKEEKRLTIEILPESPQQADFVAFFDIVVNKKTLWRSFSSWFRLDIQLENKVYNFFDPWTIGFRHLSLDIVGHQIVFDRDGKIHTCYLISIKNKPSSLSVSSEDRRGTTVKKRYSQFCTLDKHIRRFMSKNKLSLDALPALPPKFSPFGSKTSPKSRQVRFGIYLKGLIKIEGINHCIKLLEFLEFDTLKEVEVPIEVEPYPPQLSQLSYFSELNQKQ